jgi:hypothetical protein
MIRTNATQDDFWTDCAQLFTMLFPSYYTKPQKVWGRFHSAKETYFGAASEIIPLKHRKGECICVMMQPYVQEPILTLTVGLYAKPKKYADQESPIGQTIGQPETQGFREVQVGNAQAWYYPADRIIVIWECFFDDRFRRHPLREDVNMRQLWQGFERWLLQQFPYALNFATPFSDPIAASSAEYQAFLKKLGYASIAEAAFGKDIHKVLG